jgi:hypothetical protein
VTFTAFGGLDIAGELSTVATAQVADLAVNGSS